MMGVDPTKQCELVIRSNLHTSRLYATLEYAGIEIPVLLQYTYLAIFQTLRM